MLQDISCDDKICIESHSFASRCVVYTGSEPTCDPPCNLSGCKIEVHYNVLCTAWECAPKSTVNPIPVETTTEPDPWSTTTEMPRPTEAPQTG